MNKYTLTLADGSTVEYVIDGVQVGPTGALVLYRMPQRTPTVIDANQQQQLPPQPAIVAIYGPRAWEAVVNDGPALAAMEDNVLPLFKKDEGSDEG